MNNLSDFQKQILDKIIRREIYDIYSFMEVMQICKIRNYLWGDFKGFVTSENVHECNYLYELIEIDILKLRIKISEFISLCNFIEKESYIFAFPVKTRIYKPIVKFKNETEIDENRSFEFYSINQLIFSRSFYEFFPSHELDAFVKRNYTTLTQQLLLDESNDRKKAQKLTFIVAIFSIFISLCSIIVDLAFSGIERDVYVKNVNAFRDSVNVRLIQHKTVSDTTLVDDSLQRNLTK